jgi:uncharacterized membrane protein
VELLENFTVSFILFSSHVLELFGAFIIISFAVYAFVNHFRNPLTNKNIEPIRLALAKRLALGLEFKMGAEILKTVVVSTMEEVLILAAIIALRVILNLIIHWEIKNVERQHN